MMQWQQTKECVFNKKNHFKIYILECSGFLRVVVVFWGEEYFVAASVYLEHYEYWEYSFNGDIYCQVWVMEIRTRHVQWSPVSVH